MRPWSGANNWNQMRMSFIEAWIIKCSQESTIEAYQEGADIHSDNNNDDDFRICRGGITSMSERVSEWLSECVCSLAPWKLAIEPDWNRSETIERWDNEWDDYNVEKRGWNFVSINCFAIDIRFLALDFCRIFIFVSFLTFLFFGIDWLICYFFQCWIFPVEFWHWMGLVFLWKRRSGGFFVHERSIELKLHRKYKQLLTYWPVSTIVDGWLAIFYTIFLPLLTSKHWMMAYTFWWWWWQWWW